ncbi:MAG: sigma-70 family RNA polymerase sigma factor [Planctomycetes bacterium]|nr:sigma-70 family RNA polymerase sigma factor [Planctomycetota bacterium]
MTIEQDIVVRALVRERVSLLAYIDSIVRDDHMAEDVFQDVCALAVAKREEIENEVHLMRWLRKTARFRASHAMRQRFAQPMLFDGALLDEMDGLWDEHESAHADAVTAALKHCLAKLSPYARKLVNLRYAQGISGQALAAAVGRQVNAVYVALTRIHRGLGQCIRQQMKHE